MKTTKLTDKPQKWGQVLCQKAAVKQIQGLLVQLQDDNKTRSENKRAFFITGETGVGKDTLSGLMAEFLTEKPYITETTGNLLTADECRSIADNMAIITIAKRVFIVKEAQKLTAHVCTMLLEILESNAKYGNFVFVFTAMEKVFETPDEVQQRNFRALGDRCHIITLQDKNSESFRSEWVLKMTRIASENKIEIDIAKLGIEVHYSIRGGLGRLQQKIEERQSVRFSESGKNRMTKKEQNERNGYESLLDIAERIIKESGKNYIRAVQLAALVKDTGACIVSDNFNAALNASITKHIQRCGKFSRFVKKSGGFIGLKQ